MGKSKRIFIVGGATPYYEIIGGHPGLKLKEWDLTADIGLAYTFNVGDKIFRPELRYCRSIINLIGNENNMIIHGITLKNIAETGSYLV